MTSAPVAACAVASTPSRTRAGSNSGSASSGSRTATSSSSRPRKRLARSEHAADASAGTTKRNRGELAPAFIQTYERQLESPDAGAALEAIRTASTVPLLFCVERTPATCHRSLAAVRLAGGSIPVEHLLP